MLFHNNNKATGDDAESLACDQLKKHKLQILERNFRNRFGEIDIIAKDKNTVIFVEVKFRSSIKFGQPYESVTLRKQQKIIRTAEYYLQKNNSLADCDCRFDVISIHNKDVNWIQNAFNLSE